MDNKQTRWEQIQTLGLKDTFFQGQYGIELEEHRITNSGRLSHKPYPKTLGSRRRHPYLQTDYSETQHELVTKASRSFYEARDHLLQLQWVLRDHLGSDESIWPLSMPPHLLPEDLEWVDHTFGRPWVSEYRKWLQAKYGSTHEIMAGVHVNFSLSNMLLKQLFNASDSTNFVDFKNQTYFKMAQGIATYRWFIVYLFGATPFNLNHTDSRIPVLEHPVRSIRDSQYGFANDADVEVDYAFDLHHHLQDLAITIQKGQLYSTHEFYGSVRFKGSDNLEELRTQGIQYLEVRVLDTDPFDPAGISENTLNVLELLFAFIFVEDRTYSKLELAESLRLANEIALQEPTEPLPNLDEAKELMTSLSRLADEFGMRFNDGLSLIAERILRPDKTPAAILVKKANTAKKLQDWGAQRARANQIKFHVEHQEEADRLFGKNKFQMMIQEAIGLGVEVIDYNDTVITLAVGDEIRQVTEPISVRELFADNNFLTDEE